ncbi:hypothetical protein AB0J38_25960 [Streptomyces sp. NPDC050095]|uniref:hypothetical protein n=1 Tax=unclassified Streptomyces TaxID=2593676 RepID=UPI00343CBDE7
MTLQDHVAKTGSLPAAKQEAAVALLNSITEQVKAVQEGGSLDGNISRLKSLAEAYSLVIHGKE